MLGLEFPAHGGVSKNLAGNNKGPRSSGRNREKKNSETFK